MTAEVTAQRRPYLRLALAAAVLLANGCAAYHPRRLEHASPLVSTPDALQVAAATLDGRAVAGYPVRLDDGLDLTEVGILAVLNNPELKQQRARWRVASAQVFAAGLLPDPQLSLGVDRPGGNSAGLVNAYSAGLDYDLIPLITHQAQVDAARRGQDQVRLDLLWQEWQVIQQARSLAVRLEFEQQRLALLRNMRRLYQERYRRSTQALQDGNVTLDINGTDLTALLDSLSQISQLEQTHNQTRHDFNLLLGLAPQARVTLVPLLQSPLLGPDVVRNRLARLGQLRPDLLALQAGYASQEAKVRAAVLAQFPSLGIGINRARDTGNVHTTGLSISLTLPLLSGNRGNIAIERATRSQLHEEYRARLAQAQMDVDRLLELQAILRTQQDNLQTYLPHLDTLVERARRAYRRGDIDALTFLNMESTWVNKRLEEISLAQSAWENRIALEALLAMPDYPGQPLATSHASRTASP
jgi:outer membrane protein TolC